MDLANVMSRHYPTPGQKTTLGIIQAGDKRHPIYKVEKKDRHLARELNRVFGRALKDFPSFHWSSIDIYPPSESIVTHSSLSGEVASFDLYVPTHSPMGAQAPGKGPNGQESGKAGDATGGGLGYGLFGMFSPSAGP